MIESPAFYPYLSGLDNLRLLAEYAEVPRHADRRSTRSWSIWLIARGTASRRTRWG